MSSMPIITPHNIPNNRILRGFSQSIASELERGRQIAGQGPKMLYDQALKSMGEQLCVDTLDREGKIVQSAADQYNSLRFNQGYRWPKDTTYFFHPSEVTAIETMIQEILRWEPMSNEVINGAPFLPEVDIGRGKTKFNWFKETDVPAPEWSQSFEQVNNTLPGVTDTTPELLGMMYRYHLTMPEVDAANGSGSIFKLQPNKQVAIMRSLTKSLRLYQEYYKFMGGKVPNMADFSATITGLLNDSGVTAQTTLTASNDNILTAAGDIPYAATELANILMANKLKPPFVLDVSPGVLMQANINIDTGGQPISDTERLFKLTDEKKQALFSSIRVNPFIMGVETETNATAAMACFKPAKDNFFYVYSYPLSFYPLPPTTLGVDGALLFSGRTIVQRPEAIAYASPMTVAVIT